MGPALTLQRVLSKLTIFPVELRFLSCFNVSSLGPPGKPVPNGGREALLGGRTFGKVHSL
jgi:hypothetical protein